METVTEFMFLGSKITADGECSHEIERHLLLERKPLTNLDNLLKSRDIIWQQRSIESKLWFFAVVMYSCEMWTIKKAKHQRIGAFELCCWRVQGPLDCKAIKPVSPKGNES